MSPTPRNEELSESEGAASPTQQSIDGIAFMTEFNTNAQIFNQVIARIVGISNDINDHDNRIGYVNGFVGDLRNRVNSLETQVSRFEDQQNRIIELERQLENCDGNSIHDVHDLSSVLSGELVVTEDGGVKDPNTGHAINP